MKRLDKLIATVTMRIRKGLIRYREIIEESYVGEFPSFDYHTGKYKEYENEIEKEN